MEPLTYPAAHTVDQTDDYHGTSVVDPYRWLEDVDSEETHAWVAAENEVTFGFLADIPEREQYKARLTEIWNYERFGTPKREGNRIFFNKNNGLQNQSVLYVQDGPDAEPRVLLDPNTLSEDGTVSLGGTSVSRDGRWLAWSKSVSGSDWRTWHIRDVDTGEDLPDVIEWSKFSGASWDPAAEGFYYSRYDAPAEGETYEEANYFQKLYYHRRGTDQDRDVLVYERPDEKEWGFDGSVSDDGRYLVISVWHGSAESNRLFYKDLSDPDAEVVEFLTANDARYQFLGNDGTTFFILTSKDAPRQRIIAVDLARPEAGHWREIVPQSENPLSSAKILNHGFVLFYMQDVADKVQIHDLDGKHLRDIALPGLGSVGGFHGHPGDTETYYVFTSFLNPREIYHYDFTTGASTLHRAPAIDFDFSSYVTEQVFFTSKDGTRVPLFIVRAQDTPRDGSNPTILYGYGGFNVTEGPFFSTALLPWLEQGGIWVTANIRGGGEYGEEWHQGGMLANKQNCFDDFIGAAEHLMAEGYTCADKLAIYGGSNGGTLVGAVVNQRPELFGAAIPAVGVMDMLRFHEFTIGWAWVSDYGSSEDPEMFPVLHGYSPYHNLQEGVEYPAIMVTTADHDDRVVPGHSFKYAARLQAAHGGDTPVLIRIQTKAGHGGGKPMSMYIEEKADFYAFLHRVLGMGDG
ncbi:MAG: S9 family peptidase [bacterium]|nr:S9 family peptidase [bacterium]